MKILQAAVSLRCLGEFQTDGHLWRKLCLCAPAVCLAVAAVNQAVKEPQVKQTLRVLSLPEVALHGVLSQCAAAYQQELKSLIRHKTLRGKTPVNRH